MIFNLTALIARLCLAPQTSMPGPSAPKASGQRQAGSVSKKFCHTCGRGNVKQVTAPLSNAELRKRYSLGYVDFDTR